MNKALIGSELTQADLFEAVSPMSGVGSEVNILSWVGSWKRRADMKRRSKAHSGTQENVRE